MKYTPIMSLCWLDTGFVYKVGVSACTINVSTCIQNSSSVITCAVQELDKFIFTQSVGVFVSQ